MDGEQFKQRVRSGYLWNFLGQIAMVLALMSTESARSHLIEPEQIGLVVAAMWLFDQTTEPDQISDFEKIVYSK